MVRPPDRRAVRIAGLETGLHRVPHDLRRACIDALHLIRDEQLEVAPHRIGADAWAGRRTGRPPHLAHIRRHKRHRTLNVALVAGILEAQQDQDGAAAGGARLGGQRPLERHPVSCCLRIVEVGNTAPAPHTPVAHLNC
jgi:hypothetical protein